MRKLKHLYMSALLTLALSITAFGGDMQTPGVSGPPPAPSSATGSAEPIVVPINETSDSEPDTKDSATEIAFYLFDSMIYMLF